LHGNPRPLQIDQEGDTYPVIVCLFFDALCLDDRRVKLETVTTLLRNGIDLRTVHAYSGHKDLASTMRYLRPAAGTEAQATLNAVQW
jgi:hypothetical protein